MLMHARTYASEGRAVTAFFHSKLWWAAFPPRLLTSLAPVPWVPLLAPWLGGVTADPLLVPGASLFCVDSLTLSPPSTELPLLTSWESAVCFLPAPRPPPPNAVGHGDSMETPAAAGPPCHILWL